MGQIKEQLQSIRERIARAAIDAGRRPSDVKLIAVSKYQPVAAIREAYAEGVRDFGENYVQELVSKAAELADLHDLRFHLIGHLQTNKVKSVVGLVSVVHTVDSLRLADAIAARHSSSALSPAKRWPIAQSAATGCIESRGNDAKLPVFIEVNLGGEAQKSGCAPDETKELLEGICARPELRAVGLMTVPPYSEDPRASRRYFDLLRELRDRLATTVHLSELSMGMTLDLEEAIAAGATVVRIGTAIFGERPRREVV
ncbi:MAG TPA: YggS family pyridoxal phosphate-dependent enzyme [Polyangiaceae bacterium]